MISARMISDLVIAKNDSNLVGCCCVGGAPSCETACDRNRKKGDLLFKLMIKQMKNVFIFVISLENFFTKRSLCLGSIGSGYTVGWRLFINDRRFLSIFNAFH